MTNRFLLAAYRMAMKDILAVKLAIEVLCPMTSANLKRLYDRRVRQADKLYYRLMERI